MTDREHLSGGDSDNEQYFDATEIRHHDDNRNSLDNSGGMSPDDMGVTQPNVEEESSAGPKNTSQENLFERSFGRLSNWAQAQADKNNDISLAASIVQQPHINGCHDQLVEVHRVTNTPPPPSPPPIPVIPRDCSTQLRQYDKFCRKAAECIPQIPLAPHRYWIGVMNEGVRPSKHEFKQKDFTWMMGNRLTCIETVWHTYSTQSGSVDFVLHCAGIKLDLKTDKKVEMRQLDYFNNKKVYLRAVDKDAPDTVGGKFIPDDEPEVIQIDD